MTVLQRLHFSKFYPLVSYFSFHFPFFMLLSFPHTPLCTFYLSFSSLYFFFRVPVLHILCTLHSLRSDICCLTFYIFTTFLSHLSLYIFKTIFTISKPIFGLYSLPLPYYLSPVSCPLGHSMFLIIFFTSRKDMLNRGKSGIHSAIRTSQQISGLVSSGRK